MEESGKYCRNKYIEAILLKEGNAVFKELTEVFRTVYTLARTRRIEHEKTAPKSFKVGDNIEKRLESYRNPDKSSPRYKLDEYLKSLDFETIKTLQTLMYLGRDKPYKDLVNGEARYLEYRKYFDKRGWGDKDLVSRQIAGKIPLDKYLFEGFKIIGISIYE